MRSRAAPLGRAGELIAALGLAPHPEGGWYREVFRSTLRVWLMPPSLDAVHAVQLGGEAPPRHVVPASWWQAAEPLGAFAHVGATVGPGFEFADFDFLRAHPAASAALRRLDPTLARLL